MEGNHQFPHGVVQNFTFPPGSMNGNIHQSSTTALSSVSGVQSMPANHVVQLHPNQAPRRGSLPHNNNDNSAPNLGGMSTKAAGPCQNDDDIYEKLKDRKGRWLPEEEEYARFLVNEFESGLSQNIDAGSTLRAYLSKRLFCSPMRISKKFSGKRVGTQVFVSKSDGFPNNTSPFAIQMRQTGKVLESNFIQAFKRWEKDRSEKSSQRKQKHHNSTTRKTQQEVENRPRQTQMFPLVMPQCPPGKVPNRAVQAESKSSHTQHVNHFQNKPKHHTTTKMTQHAIHPMQNQLFPPGVPPCPQIFHNMGIAESKNNLIQHHSHVVSSKAANQTEFGPVERTTTHAIHVDVCTGYKKTSHQRQSFPTQKRPLKQSVTFKEGQMRNLAAMHPPMIAQRSQKSSLKSGHNIPSVSEHTVKEGDIPDLLSGFDQQRAAVKPTCAEGLESVLEDSSCTTWPKDSNFFAGTAGHESPYITSKSFDELHKCLGKGISSANMSSLDLNASCGGDPFAAEDSFVTNPSSATTNSDSSLSHVGGTTEPPMKTETTDQGAMFGNEFDSTVPSGDIERRASGSFIPNSYQVMSSSLQTSQNPILPRQYHQPTPMVQSANDQFTAPIQGNMFSSLQHFNASRRQHCTMATSVPVCGTDRPTPSYHTYAPNARLCTEGGAPEKRKRHFTQMQRSSPFDDSLWLSNNGYSKRSKASATTHTVSSSEQSSDAGFDSDPVSS